MKEIIVVIFLFISQTGVSQKQVTSYAQTWIGYINQTRVAGKWSITADIHLRTKNHFFDSLSTGVVRAGVIYHASDNLHFAAGHAYFNYFPADDHAGVSQPEHRPWQQVLWTTRFSRLRLQQRIRLEERFRRKIKDRDELAGGYHFNYRVRYQLLLSAPLSKNAFAAKTFSLYAGEEILLNFGKQILYNTLDHNRVHAGLTYHVDADDQLQFGYLNVFQQQASGNRYRMIHVARIYYNHLIDLRRGKKRLS